MASAHMTVDPPADRTHPVCERDAGIEHPVAIRHESRNSATERRCAEAGDLPELVWSVDWFGLTSLTPSSTSISPVETLESRAPNAARFAWDRDRPWLGQSAPTSHSAGHVLQTPVREGSIDERHVLPLTSILGACDGCSTWPRAERERCCSETSGEPKRVGLHGDVRRVLFVALQAHGVPPGAARAEHGGVVGTDDEMVSGREGEVLRERSRLIDVVPTTASAISLRARA